MVRVIEKKIKLYNLVRPGIEDMIYKVFESNTPGDYTYTVLANGFINLDIVGAGGGMASSSHNNDWGIAGGGGSGGYSHYENIPVTAGQEITIKVGSGGSLVFHYEWANVTGGTGGTSEVNIGENRYYADGGVGGHAWNQTNATGGAGGFGETQNGNAGTTSGYGYAPIGTAAASVYKGYGIGGKPVACSPQNTSYQGNATPAGAGYVMIAFKSGEKKKRIY